MTTARRLAVMEAFSASPCDINPAEGHLTPNIEMNRHFAKDVFTIHVMRERLPRDVFKQLELTIREGARLPAEIANVVASSMKDWALERGATHYTHWFHPMTGYTAEKHDAFLTLSSDGHLLNEFSGKMLINGEPDASSFPSGGIRSTFEARGYTAWDPTAPAFLLPGKLGHTLHIPSMFYSYSGEALDRKTPLLRSISAISRQALRILHLFGKDQATYVRPMVGAEQEYFLVDSRLAALRPDLLLTGRTLQGAPAPKGQEMEDHYFGEIPARVMAFMHDVEKRLFALGIPAKTRHNEVAPGQFELAPLYEECNIATDHNMLTMNILRHTAAEHGFVCLLHEKPFAGVNGSGKHNNWSLVDSDGENLLNPGETPLNNAQFLVFLAATLRAVHKHSMALRLGTVGAGNDHRLGANEAPPAIISVFLGEQLTDVLETLITGKAQNAGMTPFMEIGVDVLPPLPKDYSDRNRTSPFAFTGNKFEFRAVGSSQSVAPVNITLNAAVACALDDIATELEASVNSGTSLTEALQTLLPRIFGEHMPIVFNGNGYSAEWPIEAEKRGLPNLATTVDALEHYSYPEVMDVFLRTHVLSEREMLARQEILLETYVKLINIEANVCSSMIRESILPVGLRAQKEAADLVMQTRAVLGDAQKLPEEERFTNIRQTCLALNDALKALEAAQNAEHDEDVLKHAQAMLKNVVPALEQCRKYADELELIVEDAAWPFPKYAEMLWIN